MKQDITVTGKTVDEAVAIGADKLGVDMSVVEYEIIEQPKKGFLGFGETPAKVRVSYTLSPEQNALNFVSGILSDMELDATAELIEDPSLSKRDRKLVITGQDAGVLIGHHGDTLDALQYIVNLVANRREEDEEHSFTRITVDIENYREKREETLQRLARRMAEKVKKYGKPVTLEPMSSYERRIIHSEIQGIEGVTTNSIGENNNRRVMIMSDRQPAAQSRGVYRRKPDKQ